MKLRPLTGTITALATPFRDGQISYIDLKKLVAFQIKGGIDGLVPVGTTGESPTLGYDEHMEVIRFTIAEARGSFVAVGSGSSLTTSAVSRHTFSVQAAGAGSQKPKSRRRRPSLCRRGFRCPHFALDPCHGITTVSAPNISSVTCGP